MKRYHRENKILKIIMIALIALCLVALFAVLFVNVRVKVRMPWSEGMHPGPDPEKLEEEKPEEIESERGKNEEVNQGDNIIRDNSPPKIKYEDLSVPKKT